jgi:hypothetical protein
MGTSVQVTPLSGAYGEGPLFYLLAVDGFRFLLDCGWTDHCDPALLQPLARYPASTYLFHRSFRPLRVCLLLHSVVSVLPCVRVRW